MPNHAVAPTLDHPPEIARMPGHWLLARLGKRVLRPGGLKLTCRMLDALAIGHGDRVLELAPGLGATARRVLALGPRSYTGVDRDADVARRLAKLLEGTPHRVRLGQAHETGLADASCDVVLGEAMLSMNPLAIKRQIVAEAYRVLAPGGRYAIHELSLVPDDLAEAQAHAIARALSGAIHIGASPLTVHDWRALLEAQGFEVEHVLQAPMHLLEAGRLLKDEGLGGSVRFGWNLMRDRAARERVLEMRDVFRRHAANLGAIALVARKPVLPEAGATRAAAE
ncbi:MAG TPA: class I SAM-dependent methyltransferase [Oscillatoriaceae cyanobacterium]